MKFKQEFLLFKTVKFVTICHVVENFQDYGFENDGFKILLETRSFFFAYLPPIHSFILSKYLLNICYIPIVS